MTTTGSEKAFSSPSASLSDSQTAYAAVGMLFSRMKSFAKALLVSSSAAARVGPKTRRSRRSSSSTRPSASGTSGPTTVRSGLLAAARPPPWPPDSQHPRAHIAQRAAMPPLPGAQTTSPTREDFEIAHARACSRPPPPSTRTFNIFDMLSTLSLSRLGNAAIGVKPAACACGLLRCRQDANLAGDLARQIERLRGLPDAHRIALHLRILLHAQARPRRDTAGLDQPQVARVAV